MERQIPRSIQYSDLKPEVIENQVKLIRFTPQTNIQNQVPNDVVRFQLQGNGFYDPYSAYIYMQIEFGSDKTQFAIGQKTAHAGTGLAMLQNIYQNIIGSTYQDVHNGGTISSMGRYHNLSIINQQPGVILSALELNHQNMIVTPQYDGYRDSGLGHKQATLTVSGGGHSGFSSGEAAEQPTLPSRVIYIGSANTLTGRVGTSVLSDSQYAPNSQYQHADGSVPINYSPTMPNSTTESMLSYLYNGKQNGIPIPGAELKILDRSAHSFINRMVIRSQGSEIERIEQYDVVAAMLNDLIYSNEQAQFHTFEGFGGTPYIQTGEVSGIVKLKRACVANSCDGPRGRVGERIFGWAFVAVDGESQYEMSWNKPDHTFDMDRQSGYLELHADQAAQISRYLTPVAIDLIARRDMLCNSPQFGISGDYATNDTDLSTSEGTRKAIYAHGNSIRSLNSLRPNITQSQTTAALDNTRGTLDDAYLEGSTALSAPYELPLIQKIFHNSYYHPIHQFVIKNGGVSLLNKHLINKICFEALDDVNVEFFRPGHYKVVQLGASTYEFVIPIYSGLIGVLMPEKKLLPLSLMPLEVEFTLNQHALMAIASNGYGASLNRDYTVKKMEIFSHMIFFEQDVHRSMESIVAENGLFLHMNTFYMAPVTGHGANTNSVTQTIPINLHYKNINSIHMVNLYSRYLTSPSARKLHFVSHNINSVQIRNGTDLIPSEPLNMKSGAVALSEKQTISSGKYNRVFIELLKAFNKMHDPLCDTALDPGLVYQMDNYAEGCSSLATDYDINDTTFSQNQKLPDTCMTRAYEFLRYVEDPMRYAYNEGGEAFDNILCKEIIFQLAPFTDVSETYLMRNAADGYGYLTANGARGFIRGYRLTRMAHNNTASYKYSATGALIPGVDPQGGWGANPHQRSKRPNIFYTPQKYNIQSTGLHNNIGNYPGITAKILADKINRFTALTGRFQMAISLEGINLGSDNSLLCGKRGMVPFDMMITSDGKSDMDASTTLVFAKCDFIVYIRPDLVVTVLGK